MTLANPFYAGKEGGRAELGDGWGRATGETILTYVGGKHRGILWIGGDRFVTVLSLPIAKQPRARGDSPRKKSVLRFFHSCWSWLVESEKVETDFRKLPTFGYALTVTDNYASGVPEEYICRIREYPNPTTYCGSQEEGSTPLLTVTAFSTVTCRYFSFSNSLPPIFQSFFAGLRNRVEPKPCGIVASFWTDIVQRRPGKLSPR